MDKKAVVTLNQPGILQTRIVNGVFHELLSPRESLAPRLEGWKLIVLLDETGFRISVAFWAFDENESGRWRLFIASPFVDKHGPLKAYRHIQAILNKHTDTIHLSLEDISAISPKDPRILAWPASISGIIRKGNKKLNADNCGFGMAERHVFYLFGTPSQLLAME